MKKRPKLVSLIVFVLLLAVIGVQALLLVQTKDEAVVYRASDQQRREFCVAYAGMINSVRGWINAAQERTNDQTPAWVFQWLATQPFLKVCRVTEPTRSKIADSARWGCTRQRPDIGHEQDLECLEKLARELEGAVSIE